MSVRTTVAAGLVAGYAVSAMQLTDGPGGVFRRLRRDIRRVPALADLASCGWCLSLWGGLGSLAAVSLLLRDRPRSIGCALVSWGVASSIAGLYRRCAEPEPVADTFWD